jgi:predicted PurR-regulated permease PerM
MLDDELWRGLEAADAITINLRHWLVGQVVLMAAIGVTTAAGLALLGVTQALALGILAGVLELVPHVVAWLAAVPAGMAALLKGPQDLALILGLYLLLHASRYGPCAKGRGVPGRHWPRTANRLCPARPDRGWSVE